MSSSAPDPDGLNDQQRRFVAAYRGNAREAARVAGYKGPKEAAHRLITNPKVVAAIRAREGQETKTLVLDRQQRQAFWTSVIQDSAASMTDRLRASELLGRSEGDFLDRVQSTVQHQMQLPAGLGVEDLRALARMKTPKALGPGAMTVDGEVVEDDGSSSEAG